MSIHRFSFFAVICALFTRNKIKFKWNLKRNENVKVEKFIYFCKEDKTWNIKVWCGFEIGMRHVQCNKIFNDKIEALLSNYLDDYNTV